MTARWMLEARRRLQLAPGMQRIVKDLDDAGFRRPRKRKKLEASCEEACRVHAQGRGWVSRKMNGLGFRSWPDRLFLPPPSSLGAGWTKKSRFWVEFKRVGEPATPSQGQMHKDLRARGERVYVCRTKEEFARVFSEHGG